MAANISNKSRKSRNSASTTHVTGKNSAYRNNTASHEPIHSKPHINWFVIGSWAAIMLLCLAFWAGVAAMISAMF